MSITVRKALPEDAAAVYEIEALISRHPWTEEQIREEILFPQGYTCVSEENGRITGFAIMQTAAEFAHLNELGVLPGYRRRGSARKIFDDLFRECSDRGCDTMSLEVRCSNLPARTLYGLLGFRQEGMRKGFYRDPDENALVLVKKLKEDTD